MSKNTPIYVLWVHDMTVLALLKQNTLLAHTETSEYPHYRQEPTLYYKKRRFYKKDLNRTADQRLCFRYTDSAIPLLAKSEISNLYLSSVVVQPGLCRTWSETPKTSFLTKGSKYLIDRSWVQARIDSVSTAVLIWVLNGLWDTLELRTHNLCFRA